MSAKGEKYKSMGMMKKHEMGESSSARKKEYGSAKGGLFGPKKAVKKTAMKKMGKKK
jgi:hypothetical protein